MIPRPAADEPDLAASTVPAASGSSDALRTMATAGAVLQAFADGTLAVTAETESTEPGMTEPLHPDVAQVVEEPSVPDDVVFRPRTTARHVLGALTFASLVATGLATWRTYDGGATPNLSAAVGLGVLTGILAAVHGRTTVAQLTVTGSRLEVVKAGTRMVFDLADPATRMQVVGTPGERGWKVVFPRRSLPPAVIDARMVDPRAFTRVMELHRSGHGRSRLRAHPGT